METDTDLPAGATDRRTALKRAAAAAGVVAWTTPAVQVLSGGTAHAQTVTGCRPVITVMLKETGEGNMGGVCECVPDLPARCCSNNTSFPTVTADCGTTCGGDGTIVGDITLLSPSSSSSAMSRPDVSVFLSCNNIPAGLTVTATVKCADGSTPTASVTGSDITCIPCLTPGLAAPAIVPEPDVSTVDPTTTTTTATTRRLRTGARQPRPQPATTSTEPATTTSTEPPTP